MVFVRQTHRRVFSMGIDRFPYYFPRLGRRKFSLCVCLMMICDWSAQNTQSTQIQQVTQFHITNWSPDGVCTNLATITDVIEEVDKVQRRTGNQPIVVHCRYLLPLCLDHVRSHDASSSCFLISSMSTQTSNERPH